MNERKKQELIFFFLRARLNPSNPAIAPARTAAAELSVPVFGSAGVCGCAGCTGCSGTSGVGSVGTSELVERLV